MPLKYRMSIFLLVISSYSTILLADSDDINAMQCNKDNSVCVYKDELSNRRFFVNDSIYSGWQVFRSHCNACHLEGEDYNQLTEGASPALLTLYVKAGDVYAEKFKEFTLDGLNRGRGWMPAWKGDPIVASKVDDIWAYLSAVSNRGIQVTGGTRFSRLKGSEYISQSEASR